MRRNVLIIFLALLTHQSVFAQVTADVSHTSPVGAIIFTLLILIAVVFILYRRQKRRFND